MESLYRVVKTSWQGFRRNGWLSFVAIFMMMQALLLITIFVSLNLVVNKTIQAVNERIDVAIFFKEYIPEGDILIFKDQIDSVEGIKAIKYISQEEALVSYLDYNRDSQELIDLIGNDSSFLPASLEIKMNNPDLIESVVEQVMAHDKNGLILETTLKKNQNVIDRLRKINKFVGVANVVLSLIFVIIALLIIFNTIRITIFTRREEIEIMKLVGATDWYIRWPFIIEGVFYGIAGALLAFAMSVIGYWILISSLDGDFFSVGFADLNTNVVSPWFLLELLLIQLLIGIVVGSISSYLSTKRHLR